MNGAPQATLLTGGSGFLGSLVAAALLAERKRHLLLPLRPNASAGDSLARIEAAIIRRGLSPRTADQLVRLATVVELPTLDRLAELDRPVRRMQVDEVVHCAGCVDYFDRKLLQAGNVDLTCRLLDAAREWRLRRFVYLSTAYCAGYSSGLIPERLHADPAPGDEPTEYTRSKRIAERHIAGSGIPYVIIRPSVIIGDSRTGIYTGKNYGLYQMWRAFEGLLCREYYPVWHMIAPPAPVDFVHQDAFEAAFLAIYRAAEPDAIVHVVGDRAARLTLRDLCLMWTDVYWPVEIRSYDRVDDVPLSAIPPRQRKFLELTAKNFEIAAHPWIFDTTQLDRLRAGGLDFADTSHETIARCQSRYISGSTRIQEHRQRYAARPGGPPRLIEMSARAAHATSPAKR